MSYNSSMNPEQEFRKIANQLVTSMIGADHVAAWWASPNLAFDSRTPEEQWQSGSDQVVNYLMHHAFAGGGS
jgi:hypothetical protein